MHPLLEATAYGIAQWVFYIYLLQVINPFTFPYMLRILTGFVFTKKRAHIVFCYNSLSLYCMFPLKAPCREHVKYGAREVQSQCVLFDVSHPC